MIESYSVGARFILVDDFTPKLLGMFEELAKFDAKIAALNEGFSKFGAGFGQGLIEGFAKIGKGFTDIEEKAASIGTGITAEFTKIGSGIGTAVTEGVATATREIEGLQRKIAEAVRLPGTAGSGNGGGGGRVAGGSAGGEGKGDGAFIDLQTGMLAGFGFEEFAHGIEHVVEAGAKLQHFQAQLEAATGSAIKMQDATTAAWNETSRNLNTTVSENLKNIQHLMNVTGDMEEAKKMLHPFTMADTALASIKDDEMRSKFSGAGAELNTYNVARSLEQLGVTQDEAKLNDYIGNITRMMIGMRGLVDGSKLFSAVNNAGGARYGWDEDFVTYGLGPLIQATNGKAGAQLYQLSRSYGQGVSTQMMAEGAEKYGLWNKDDENWVDGKFKGMKVGSVFEADTLKHDPVKWAGNVREMMRGRGVDVDDTDVMTNAVAEMTRGNKNLGAIMDELILPKAYQALIKERGNIAAVPQDAVGQLQKNDPGLALKEFTAQWNNLLTALGKTAVPEATQIMKDMAEGLNVLARWADAHPGIAKVLMEGFVGVTAALGILAAGSVLGMLALFAPAGAWALGAAALVGTLGSLVAFNWVELKTKVSEGIDFLKSLPDAIGKFVDDLIAKAKAIFGPSPLERGTAGFSPGAGLLTPGDQGLHQDEGLLHRMAFIMGGSEGTGLEDVIYRGTLRAFSDFANGVGIGGSTGGSGGGGGFIKASYGGNGFGGSGGSGLGNISGSIGDGSAVDRALGLKGAGEGQAAHALGHMMHFGEWCADFVNGSIEAAGGKGSGSAMARSFMHWGTSVGLDQVRKGDVAVLNGGGHVGFFTGERGADGRLGVIAGNTRDGHGGHDVEHYFVSPGSVYGARRGAGSSFIPPPQKPRQAPQIIQLHADGKIWPRS